MTLETIEREIIYRDLPRIVITKRKGSVEFTQEEKTIEIHGHTLKECLDMLSVVSPESIESKEYQEHQREKPKE